MTIVPAMSTADEALAHEPDGIFLSNGPGDPEPCDYAIRAIERLMDEGLPVFGICLGHQLMALASGAETVKMPHGHHGANHPVQDLGTGQVIITSQNHGFAVDEATLPNCLEATHVSLFRRNPAGHPAHGPSRVRLPGPPGSEPGPPRTARTSSTGSSR